MSRYFQVYKFTREDGVHDGRWLSATGDGAMRWVSTRGDAHKLTRAEAEALATYIARVYIGHLALVVGDAQSPLEALAKPAPVKRARANPSTRTRRKASARKAASSGARSPRPAARRAGGPRFRYRAEARMPGRRAPHVATFTAKCDESALAYCNGLWRSRLPKGAQVTRLERVGPATARAQGSKKKR